MYTVGMTPELGIAELNPLVRQILQGRGYSGDEMVAEFLWPAYERSLHDPFLLTDMEPAVARIQLALKQNQPIVVYGDYDIDGITATAVLTEVLAQLGAKVTSYIPDRFEEGYGINLAALKKLQKGGAKLIVSVDCGVTSVTEVAWAQSHGLDVVITDHHSVPETLPAAVAVVNPKRTDDLYPFKDLAGVGVVFKLVQALQQRGAKFEIGQEKWLLDLVALGTVCDVVSLVGENRALVKYGLLVVKKTRRVGLRALADVAGVRLGDITSYHFGFLFGPRLNAAGRLQTAAASLELLTTTSTTRARELAESLDVLNRERQETQATILEEANQQAALYSADPVLVLASPDWSHGIVGIVASKLVERWHKPAIVMQILGEDTKGSGRSVANFNLIEGLQALAPLFSKFGGHHFAAGLTLKTDQIDEFRRRLIEIYQATATAGINLPEWQPEVSVEDFEGLDLTLTKELDLLEPFGNANPKPILGAENLKLIQVERIGKQAQHLKLRLSDSAGHVMTALGFGMAEKHPNLNPGQKVTATFQLVRNDFWAEPRVELVLKELR